MRRQVFCVLAIPIELEAIGQLQLYRAIYTLAKGSEMLFFSLYLQIGASGRTMQANRVMGLLFYCPELDRRYASATWKRQPMEGNPIIACGCDISNASHEASS